MTIRLLTAGLVVLLFLSSTTIGSLHGAKVIRSETGLIMGTTDSVESCLDPASAYDFFGWQIIGSLGCGLVEHKVEASGSPDQFAQSLATSWNVSEDGLTWTFDLRHGVKYDDETEFNATHVKYTFDRGIGIADPNGAWLGIGYGDIIRNVTVVNDYTIRFDLNMPFAPFLSLLALPVAFIVDPVYAPMNQIVTYSEGNPRASNPMGLGPYVLKTWTRVAGRDIEMELETNPNYWNASAGIPKTKNITIQFYQSSSTLASAVGGGEVDIAFRQLTTPDIVTLKSNANLQVWEGNGAFVQYLVLQEEYAPFNVTAIRKAVGAAVNRTALVQTVFLGQAQSLYSIIPTGMFGHTDAFLYLGDPNYTFARELLAPLGYNESNKLTFTLWYEISGHYPQSQQQAQMLKASIEASEVITVNLQGIEWPSMRTARNAGTMEAFIFGWYPDYIDPDDYAYPLVHSVGASWLNYHYSNASVDELIEAGRENFTAAERTTIYGQIQNLVAQDCPIIPLYQSLTQAVSAREIEGIYLDLTGLLRLWHISREIGPVYIRADGSIDPPTAPISTVDNVTYTLTGNIRTDTDGIIVERDDIVIDGADFMLEGNLTSSHYGVYLDGRSNVTIKNTNIRNFGIGVELQYSSNNGISGNKITNNTYAGVDLYYSSNNIVSGNKITNNTYMSRYGIKLQHSTSNTVSENSLEDHSYGIWLWYHSDFSSISGNTITNNGEGISLGSSSNNIISGNNITNNYRHGIWLGASSNNNISENNVIDNHNGIDFSGFCPNNSISGNNITNNSFGIELHSSSNNTFCHNNFIENTFQVNDTTPSYVNYWDNGCEGNFWSNYNGADVDNDGVGDTLVPWEGVDNCPLMNEYWNPCDINHDLKVDFKDIGRSARAFGTVPGDTWWNPHADITGPTGQPDGKVDMRDISLIARHFMEHYL